MNFEQQLKDDYERTRIPAPVQLGAYDRFLRRRARYARRVVAATSATLAAALALAVVVPRVLADRNDVADRPKEKVVSRPALGYELVVPPGWRVAGQDAQAGLVLEPTTGAPGSVPSSGTAAPATATTAPKTSTTAVPTTRARSFLPRVAVTPVILDPDVFPGRPAGERPGRLPEGPQLNAGPQPERPRGPCSRGRAAGRRPGVQPPQDEPDVRRSGPDLLPRLALPLRHRGALPARAALPRPCGDRRRATRRRSGAAGGAGGAATHRRHRPPDHQRPARRRVQQPPGLPAGPPPRPRAVSGESLPPVRAG